jgi:uncharacterized membrane protein
MISSFSSIRRHPRLLDYSLGLLFIILAAIFSFVDLGGPSIWVDEGYTWLFSQLSWDTLLESARIDGVNPPLYYVAVKLIASFIQADEVGLRLFSSLVNLIALVGALILGHRVGGRAGLVVSGWFWAFHPMILWYARDARPYALAATFAIYLVIAFIYRENRSRSTRWIIMTILLMSMGLLTHYFFFLLIAGLTTYRVYRLRENPELFREWAIMLLAAIIPLGIWIYWYLQQAQPSLGIGWIQAPQLLDLLITPWNLISGYGGVFSISPLLFGSSGILLVFFAIRKMSSNSREMFASVFGMLIPIVAVWILSLRRPVFVDRYFIVLLPFLIILLSSGAQRTLEFLKSCFRQGAIIHPALFLVLLLVGVWSAVQIHVDIKFANEDWRGLVEQYNNLADKDDTIWLMEPEVQLPLKYYGLEDLEFIDSEDPPKCETVCWWILRQPYTATHAFTQSVPEPNRPWLPEIPPGCQQTNRWDSATGIGLWRVTCDS